MAAENVVPFTPGGIATVGVLDQLAPDLCRLLGEPDGRDLAGRLRSLVTRVADLMGAGDAWLQCAIESGPQVEVATSDLARQLAAGGLTVIAVLHDLNLAALYAQRLALLAHGQLLVCDTPEHVLTAGWLRQAYGVDVLVGAHPHYPIPQLSLLRQAEP